MFTRNSAAVAVISALIVVASFCCTVRAQETAFPKPEFDMDLIASSVMELSNFGTRVTGYPGCDGAADYIADQFMTLGLSVTRQTYNAAIPYDFGSHVTLMSAGMAPRVVKAYAVWPNLVQTSMTDRSSPPNGPLVYVGGGSLAEMNGKRIEGSIVLMDFNSGSNWLYAAELGAKAVIFLGTRSTVANEALSKFLNTPVHFPRLYVTPEDGDLLKDAAASGGTTVEVAVNMRYVSRQAQNILAVLNGTTLPNEAIVIMAHYDDWFAAPGIAPGADEAVSMGALLALAKYFKGNRPARTIWFVALSGHYEALVGAREFVESFFLSPRVMSGDFKIWVWEGLDLSTDGDGVAAVNQGDQYFYGSTGLIQRWKTWFEGEIFDVIVPKLERSMGKSYSVQDAFQSPYGWWGTIYGGFSLDSEAPATANALSFTLKTNDVQRQRWYTPQDVAENVDLDMLMPQLEVAWAIAYELANIGEMGIPWSATMPMRFYYGSAGANIVGFITARGVVQAYNISRAWYSPVPDLIVTATLNSPISNPYPFVTMVTIADERGDFEFHGLSNYGSGGPFTQGSNAATWYFNAYGFDPEKGVIAYAPDNGQYGTQQIINGFAMTQETTNVTTIVFKCSSAVLWGLIDPRGMRPLATVDPRFGNGIQSSVPASITVYDFQTVSQFLFWGTFMNLYDPVGMIFIPPGTRFMAIYRVGPDLSIAGILINASLVMSEGEGYYAGKGTQLSIISTQYQFLKDAFYLTQGRYGRLSSAYVRSAFSEEFLTNAMDRFTMASEAIEASNYSDAASKVNLAWSWSIQAYQNTMSTIFDTLSVNAVFFLLFIAFALVSERLIFQASGLRRFVTTGLIIGLLMVVYYFTEPAVRVAQNFFMNPLSTLLVLTFLIVTALFMSEAMGLLRTIRSKTMGEHFAESTTGATSLVAFSVGWQNLRKRKMRTGLVMTTIVIVTFSMMALTSSYPAPRISYSNVIGGAPTYQGVLLRAPQWIPAVTGGAGVTSTTGVQAVSLGPWMVNVIEELAGHEALISPRYWIYPQSQAGRKVATSLLASSNRSYDISAIIGLSELEAKIFDYEAGIIDGTWLVKGLGGVCLIPRQAAEALGVSVGDGINVMGLRLKVIGIYESSILNQINDLDGFRIAPDDPNRIQFILQGVTLSTSYSPLSWDQVIIIPEAIAKDQKGYLVSIAVKIQDAATLIKVTDNLAPILYYTLFYTSDGQSVQSPNLNVQYGATGWIYSLGPIIIGAFTILNTMLGNIKERTREIGIYSSVGVSPSSITVMFFAEGIIYTLAACVIGYILGMVANVYLIINHLLPETFITNSSSFSTLIIVGLSFAFVMISVIYPARIASRMITPSLERKWRMSTKAVGDAWALPLPFTMQNLSEAKAVLRYLAEYFESRKADNPDPFIVRDLAIDDVQNKLMVNMALKPLEAGVVQSLEMTLVQSSLGTRINLDTIARRLSGNRDTWTAVTPGVVDILRKQLLMWRGLSPQQREIYMRAGDST